MFKCTSISHSQKGASSSRSDSSGDGSRAILGAGGNWVCTSTGGAGCFSDCVVADDNGSDDGISRVVRRFGYFEGL